MSSDVPAVALSHVSKSYGELAALRDVSLKVERGQLFGLIGPSGCGKTTLVRLLVGVLEPTDGTVRVMGDDPKTLSPRQREGIGYTPQGFYLYPTLTVRENANFVAGLYGLGLRRRRQRIRTVLQFLELWDARDRLARDLSGGMQRRLALACALLHEPSLLLVDEPTAGLDPVLRTKIWEYLDALRDQGTTVLVTTQHIDEATYCDTVAVMSQGQVLAVDSPEGLRQYAMGGEQIDVAAPTIGRREVIALRELDGVRAVRWTDRDTLRLVVDDAATVTPRVVALLQEHGVEVEAVEPYEPTFDEVFMRIVSGRD